MVIKKYLEIFSPNFFHIKISQSAGILKFYKKYIIIIGSTGQLLFYLQAFKIYSQGSAKDVSLTGIIIAFFSLLSWLLYGVLIKDRPLIITNVIGVLGAFLALISIILT